VQRGIVQVEFKRADSGDGTAATDDPDETSALEGDH
jgi:hypothetical protein